MTRKPDYPNQVRFCRSSQQPVGSRWRCRRYSLIGPVIMTRFTYCHLQSVNLPWRNPPEYEPCLCWSYKLWRQPRCQHSWRQHPIFQTFPWFPQAQLPHPHFWSHLQGRRWHLDCSCQKPQQDPFRVGLQQKFRSQMAFKPSGQSKHLASCQVTHCHSSSFPHKPDDSI